MSMGGENLVGLMCHGRFDTCVLFQSHQKGVTEGSMCIFISRVGRVITIWHEVFVKIRVSFDELVYRKYVLSKSSHCIETHLYVAVKILEV